jgi:hypothetical protein
MFNWGNVGHIATEDKYLTPTVGRFFRDRVCLTHCLLVNTAAHSSHPCSRELEDMILREMNICIYLFSFLKNGMVDYTLW